MKLHGRCPLSAQIAQLETLETMALSLRLRLCFPPKAAAPVADWPRGYPDMYTSMIFHL